MGIFVNLNLSMTCIDETRTIVRDHYVTFETTIGECETI